MIIGLTGGIASGKSTVSKLLVKYGAYLVDADQVSREIVEPGEAALAEIISEFGQAVLHEDGTLNRSALGQIVFNDKNKLKKLEAITHPAIRQRMQQKLFELSESHPESLIVADIPLLFETKQASLFQEGIMLVYVPLHIQLERLMNRNELTEEQARQRIALQMDIEQKKQLATWIIDNSGTLEDTENQVITFLRKRGLI